MSASLGSRIAAGAAWMVAFKLLDRSIGIVSVVILARLLGVEDFGLVAMATAVVAIAELLSAFNFDLALIQSRHATRAQLDTAWTLNVIMAAACALLVAAAALPAAAFYGDARLGPVMLWLALATWIRGFENIGVVEFRRELSLQREFQLLLVKRVAVFAVTVSAALATRSYWALVAGILAGSLAGIALSYLFHPYRPGFDLSARSELLHFSRWMVFSNIINTLAGRAADLVIGKAAGAGPLGHFSLAHEIAHLPSTELSAPINRAAYPGYAKLATDRTQLAAQFLNVLGWTALLTAPLAFGIAAVAPLLVPFLLGDKWREAVPMMEILVLSGLLASLRTNAGYVLLALGRSELLTLANGLRLSILLPALIFGTSELGAEGAAWGTLATSIAMLPIIHLFMHRAIGMRWAEYGSVLWRPAVAAAGMAVLVRAYLGWAYPGLAAGDGLKLASAVFLGIVAYAVLIGVLWSVSGFPQSTEARALGALRGSLRSLRKKG